VLPIAILSMEFGITGGLAAASMAFALFYAWAVAGHASVSVIGYFTRGVMFPGVGWLVGRLAAQRRLLESQSRRWFEISNAMLGEVNFDGYFTRVSSAWERCLGFSPQRSQANRLSISSIPTTSRRRLPPSETSSPPRPLS